jgi:hypothetical protein
MEKNQMRLRINLESREFEVEGDTSYIDDRFGKDIDEYTSLIKQQRKAQAVQPTETAKPLDVMNISPTYDLSHFEKKSLVPASFGEYFSRFAKGISIVDKLLLSCYFVQSTNTEKVFTLKEAADLLIDQGVKLSNPNAFNKANTETKRVFKLSGKNYKVSEIGIAYINELSKA